MWKVAEENLYDNIVAIKIMPSIAKVHTPLQCEVTALQKIQFFLSILLDPSWLYDGCDIV